MNRAALVPLRRSTVAVLTAALLAGCTAPEMATPSEQERFEMTESAPADAAFESVEPDSFGENACTPQIDDFDVEFRGLKLHGPKQVALVSGAEWAHFVICGTGVFDWNFMELEGEFLESIVIVAVDEKSNQSRSGRMRIIENREEDVPLHVQLGLEPEDFADRSIQEYFNPDVGTLLELPPAPAVYSVYATLGEFKSNVVEVTVTSAKAGD